MKRFEVLECRLMLSAAPLVVDGFDAEQYAVASQLSGADALVAGFEGDWTGSGSTSIEAGSLHYAGFGSAGANRVRLNGSITVSREFATEVGDPLSNFIDVNGDIGASQDGSALYLSFLMQVDGSSPPASTFSLYNDGVSSTDREFRILYSETNSSFQAIAGPSGAAANLDALNNLVNLFVVKIEFSPGNDTISVWQNPTAGAAEPTPDAQIANYDIAFDRLAFTRFGGTGAARFDELRFGSAWSAVTDEAALEAAGPQIIVAMQEPPPSPLGNGTFPSEYFPFIDEFGQFRYLEWDGKIHSVDELVQSAADEAADLAANPGPADFNSYGGWSAGPQLEATGYFRTEKVNGKWWLVDPDGRLFFSNGITGVSDAGRDASTSVAVKTGVSGREHYFAQLPEPGDPAAEFLAVETSVVTSGYYQGDYPLTMNFFAANALSKYGADWQSASQDVAHDRLRSWGMNTIGAWSDENVYLQDRTAYTMVLFPSNPSLINGNGTFPDYFDPAYLLNVKNRILAEAGKTLDDPWNIGYFIHNELSWTRSTTQDVDVGLAALAATPAQHAKIAFRDQLMAKYGTIQALNAQWQTSYASWADFLVQRNVTPHLAGAKADLTAFDALYAMQYFSATQEGMRDAAPNHLYLGARFTGGVRLSAAQAAMAYADVVSINRYGPDVSVLPAGLEGDVPLISGEYHYSAHDTGLWSDGLRTAIDQADRADKFSTYLLSALESDRYVGVHWLQYWDFPTSGRLNNNNNNSNLGFVSIADVPYAEMVDAARTIGASLYELRIGDFAFVVDRALYVAGTEASDEIILASSGEFLNVTRKGETRQFASSTFDTVVVSIGNGVDELSVTGLLGKTVLLQGADAGDVAHLTSGMFTFAVESGAEEINVLVGSEANVNLIAGTRIGSLADHGRVNLLPSPQGPGALTVGALIMGPTATLDLRGNGLIVDYVGASPLESIRSAIASAYNSGNWNGVGITTSYGDAAQSAIGYGESSVVLGLAGGMFMGRPADATSVLIRHTLYGDANLSGGVDGADFNRWNANQMGGGDWTEGDFNYDGGVNALDFNLWHGNVFTNVADVQHATATLAVATSAVAAESVAVASSFVESVAPTEITQRLHTVEDADVAAELLSIPVETRTLILSPLLIEQGELVSLHFSNQSNVRAVQFDVSASRNHRSQDAQLLVNALLSTRQDHSAVPKPRQVAPHGDEDSSLEVDVFWVSHFLPRLQSPSVSFRCVTT